MILTAYRKIRDQWLKSTSWENSPMSCLLEQKKCLIPFYRQKKISVEYYNRQILVLEYNLRKEIRQCKARLELIKETKNLKELNKYRELAATNIYSDDFDYIKGRLIIWYKTKIKHDEKELFKDSQSQCCI